VQHPAALVAVGGHHKAKIPNMIAFARLAGTAAEGNFEENLAPLATGERARALNDRFTDLGRCLRQAWRRRAAGFRLE
jgi:hypothetical protein